jgi:diguanylate cyclase (GGDEF)-like protein
VTLLTPIRVGSDRDPTGAVAIHLPSGEDLTGPARAELMAALNNAGPRLAKALIGDRAKRQAKSDPLTGLANRRGLEEALGQVDVREGALIYVDYDHFKQLNDTLGHDAGDAALGHLARVIREQVRAGDTAARIGGEEFAVWLPRASLALGMRIAERIRIKLGTTPWDWHGRHWPLSASFGVAACPETNRSIDNLPGQADAALYVAKRSGRNRVEAAGTGGR